MPRALTTLAALLLAIPLGVHGADFSPVSSEREAADAASNYLANVQRVLESQIVPKVRQGIIELATTHPASLSIFITEDPSPYHLSVTEDKGGAIVVRISLGYLAMHDAALDASALASALKLPLGLKRYLRYQLAIARENEMRTKEGRIRVRAKSFPEFQGLKQSVVQAIYAQPQWQDARKSVGGDSLGWIVSYLLVLHDRRLSGDDVPVPASASAARLAGAADFFPAPPFSTAYQLEEIANPGQESPPDQRLLCRAADFLDSGVSLVASERKWQIKASQDEMMRIRIQNLRDDVALIRRDARCTKRDSAET